MTLIRPYVIVICKGRKATASHCIKQMGANITEKRQFPRISLRSPLRFQIRGDREPGNALTYDISLGGLSFITNSFIPPQTILALEVNVLSRLFFSNGRIAWSAPLPHSDMYRVGVEFQDLEQAQRDFLSDYVDLRRKSSLGT